MSTVAANQEPMLERDNKREREREGYALAFEKSYKYFESIFWKQTSKNDLNRHGELTKENKAAGIVSVEYW